PSPLRPGPQSQRHPSTPSLVLHPLSILTIQVSRFLGGQAFSCTKDPIGKQGLQGSRLRLRCHFVIPHRNSSFTAQSKRLATDASIPHFHTSLPYSDRTFRLKSPSSQEP